jgi:hypothetical protein
MAQKTLITALPDGNFSLVEVPDQRQAGFAPMTPSLTEEGLREELLHRGVSEAGLDDLILLARQKGTASW